MVLVSEMLASGAQAVGWTGDITTLSSQWGISRLPRWAVARNKPLSNAPPHWCDSLCRMRPCCTKLLSLPCYVLCCFFQKTTFSNVYLTTLEYVPQMTLKQSHTHTHTQNTTEKIYKHNKIQVKHNVANPFKLLVTKCDLNKLSNSEDANEKNLNEPLIQKRKSTDIKLLLLKRKSKCLAYQSFRTD